MLLSIQTVFKDRRKLLLSPQVYIEASEQVYSKRFKSHSQVCSLVMIEN